MAVAEREITVTQVGASDQKPGPLRWTRAEYYRMAELGLFDNKRVALMEGEIVTMPPIGPEHRSVTTINSDALRTAFGANYFVSVQSPFHIGTNTDPEPDIAVIPGSARDFLDKHPTSAALIVEVSDSTLNYDQTEKAKRYAQAGIADYWIVNLRAKQVEVYRLPREIPGTGFGYAEKRIYLRGETISPLTAPDAQILVTDLLP